jgi:hypothetical protein
MRTINMIEFFGAIEFIEESCAQDSLIDDYNEVILDTSKKEISIDALDDNVVTQADLPIEAIQLYTLIHSVVLEDWFKYAITESIANNDCVLNNKLKEKLAINPFGDPTSLYIRVPVGKSEVSHLTWYNCL